MAYVVTNNPWTSQYSVGVGTETPLGGGSEKTIHLSDGGGGYATVYVTNSANTVRSIFGMQSSANLGIVGTQTNTPFAIFTNDTDRMRITSAGLVGIGTSTPSSLLHLAGGGTGTRGALRISEAGLTNYWELGRDNTVSGDFTINSNATERMRITTTGNVGIGTSTPGTYKLNVNGTFYSAGSSLEYKKDIATFDADTNKILELRPVTYQYKDEYKHLGKELKSGTQIGLIAEEVAEVFPELAILKEDEDGVIRVRNVDYEKLSILLLSEVQKLRKEVNALYKA